MGDTNQAVELYHKALSLDPGDTIAELMLSKALDEFKFSATTFGFFDTNQDIKPSTNLYTNLSMDMSFSSPTKREFQRSLHYFDESYEDLSLNSNPTPTPTPTPTSNLHSYPHVAITLQQEDSDGEGNLSINTNEESQDCGEFISPIQDPSYQYLSSRERLREVGQGGWGEF
eukprot:TRINITY_DN8238_c2_g1_i1.p1 TRINITY_DN8238_c2_g1~~TRINITY_DN8238_c2_g1_i1.p1  ORF type:complete len:184 (+),score=56.34 TRINITY_DN8238_c2_g1_i1:38-553(+)